MTRRMIFLLLSALSTAGAFAQDGPGGRIVGRLTDDTGGVLPGVMIELKTETGVSSTATTSVDGEYSFDNLVPARITCRFR